MSFLEAVSQASHPIIMGIVNVTPDSFSDGVPDGAVSDFLAKATQLIDDGAHILDIGGESTRPYQSLKGFSDSPRDLRLSEQKEKQRVLPFLKAFRDRYPDFPLSLDTKKYGVAQEAMPYGIDIINDVSCAADENLVKLAYDHGCDYVLMHSRGDQSNMIYLTDYDEGVVEGVKKELSLKLQKLTQMGWTPNRLILDPGFGFAKTPEQCREMMAKIETWSSLNHPLLFGVSRKRFLQLYTGESRPEERDEISAQLAQKAFGSGFDIIRTHNVALTREVFSKVAGAARIH